jgi:hypothetical protein
MDNIPHIQRQQVLAAAKQQAVLQPLLLNLQTEAKFRKSKTHVSLVELLSRPTK